uniref:Uncharacterized protein n=1 Tax=Ciona savignyi TaxID=51511 RepID=H2ZBA6_CIOSA
MDVLQMDKEAACQQSENQVVELEKAAIWVRDLESQLPVMDSDAIKQMQRPGADDVMVLKKELVSVQTLMDQMTQESEERSHKVLQERQELQRLLDEARERAIVVQQEFDQFKAENKRLKVENQEKDVENVASKKTFQNEQDKLKMSYTENEAIRVEELANIQAA